jgi:hypothetical protein
MKNIVERYVYAVTKRLKENQREEVKVELTANIYDMLSDNPKDEEIEKVLKNLGHPRVLAKNYQGEENYVVSPVYFHDYIFTLKIVAVILVSISMVSSLFDRIINLDETNVFLQIIKTIGHVIANGFQSALIAFAIVTLIFWIIEYVTKHEKCVDSWSIKDLPELPKEVKKGKISRTESIIELVLSTVFQAIFIIVLMNYVDTLIIYNDGVHIINIFNKEVTDRFIIFFIISLIISVIVYSLKIYYSEWKINLAVLYSSYEVLSAVLFVIFINQPNLILYEFFELINENTEFSINEILNGYNTFTNVITGFIIVIVAIDLIVTWLKTFNLYKQK